MSGFIIREVIDENIKHLVAGRVRSITFPPNTIPIPYAQYVEMTRSIQPEKKNEYGTGVRMTIP